MKRNILILPAISKRRYLSSSNEMHYFECWPANSFTMTVIGAYRTNISKKIFAYRMKFFPVQGIVAFIYVLFHRIDAIICFGSQSAMTIGLLLHLLGKRHPPLVLFDVEKLGRKTEGISLRFIRLACKRFSTLFCYSKSQLGYYERFVPELKNRTRFIHLGIIPEEKQLSPDLSGKEPYLVALGSPQTDRMKRKIRDWSTLIRASKTAARDTTIRVYGSTSLSDEDRCGEPLPKNIVLNPFTPKNILSPIIEKSLFCLLPLWEIGNSQGQLTLLYLMSLGKAVIVSRTTGVEDYVEDGVTGLLYTPGDSASLANSMGTLLSDKSLTERIGRTAYKTVRDKYTCAGPGMALYRLCRSLWGEENDELPLSNPGLN